MQIALAEWPINQFIKADNSCYELTVLLYILWCRRRWQWQVSRKCVWVWGKVIYTKYSKHCLYTVAHTIDCVCSKINNSWFNPWFSFYFSCLYPAPFYWMVYVLAHGLRTPREEKAFTARPKIHSHSQIFRYGQSIFCLPLRPNFSDIFDFCLHWVSVVRAWVAKFARWKHLIITFQKFVTSSRL